MYDTDEEIKRKRRTLFIVIGIIVFLILLLLIFLFTRNKGKNNGGNEEGPSEITCTLEVQNGVTPDSTGAYHQPVTVGFKSITAISKDYQITKQAIGTSDNSRNKDTFTAIKTGKYHLYGYVQDNVGHKGKCELNLVITLSNPACELGVVKGTLGDNGWYRSDVEVGFNSMDANNSSLSIVKYYIEKEMTSLDSSEVVKAEQPAGNVEKYVVKDNQVTSLIGHVIDSAGNEGTCRISVKKDSTIPTCNLKVLSGTKNANGEYTDEPVIGMGEAKDATSEIAGKGVGIAKNYNQEKFTVTGEGKTTVVGYVKDKAGNKGECTLDINKGTSSSSGSNKSNPSCKLSVTYKGKLGNSYLDYVKVGFQSKTSDNGAEITEFGLGTSAQLNGSSTLRIEQPGQYTVYGMVKDSNGVTAECRATFSIVKEQKSEPVCALYVDATQLSDGTYSKGATVKFRTKTSTNGAEIVDFGIGTDYKLSGNDTFSVGVGTYKVYGMVKDSYGHEAKCGPIDFTVTSQSSGGSGGSGSGGSGGSGSGGSGSGGSGGSGSTTGTLASTVLKQGDIVSYKTYKSVTCENKSDIASKNTWEVFRVKDNKVELISTGIPECYNFPLKSKASTAISEMKTRAKTYLDSNLATASRIMTKDDALVYGGAEDLKAGAKRNTGVYYWLATQGSASTQLYGVRNGGAPSKTGFIFDGSGRNYCIRPIVTLKADVYATKNSSGVWVLSIPNKGQEEIADNSMFDKLLEIVNSTLLADFRIEE